MNDDNDTTSLIESDTEKSKIQEADDANTTHVRNAAKVLGATGTPWGKAVHGIVSTGDKFSGGRFSRGLGKATTLANRISPGGRKIQRKLNKTKGAAEVAGKIAGKKNGSSESLAGDKNLANNDSAANGSKKIKAIIKFPKRIVYTFVAILLLLPIIILALIIVVFSNEDAAIGEGAGYATSGYYNIGCEDVTVIFTNKDNNYEVTGQGTYPLEEYVAGVLNGEVGEFNNLEVYKEYAIAARTYFAYQTAGKTDCTIESSDRKQVFRPSPNALMRQAAEETKGEVLLNSDGRLMLTEYDAFCTIDVDDNYYTLGQKNQKIPKKWVEDQNGIKPKWKEPGCNGNHGRGSSQWGSYYLATEKNYNYSQLLNYYYSTDDIPITIGSSSFIESIANLDIKSTVNASNQLNQPISSFLTSKGSSLEEYNNYIEKSVREAGVGTRAGVVTAAVSAINYLYDNFNTKIMYYWNGYSEMTKGISPNIGKNIPSSRSVGGNIYYFVGFDCSGFVSWAIKNGGYNVTRMSVNGLDNLAGSSNMCDITKSSCIGQPGDFISYKETHIKMIVSVDKENNRYYVAESGDNGVVITTQPMHSKGRVDTNILLMDEFYNNQNNVNHNY